MPFRTEDITNAGARGEQRGRERKRMLSMPKATEDADTGSLVKTRSSHSGSQPVVTERVKETTNQQPGDCVPECLSWKSETLCPHKDLYTAAFLFAFFKIKIYLFLFHICECFACIHTCVPRRPEEVFDLLELVL